MRYIYFLKLDYEYCSLFSGDRVNDILFGSYAWFLLFKRRLELEGCMSLEMTKVVRCRNRYEKIAKLVNNNRGGIIALMAVLRRVVGSEGG